MIPGLGQEMYKTNVGLDLHFTKFHRSLLALALLALLEDIGEEEQHASRAGEGVTAQV